MRIYDKSWEVMGDSCEVLGCLKVKKIMGGDVSIWNVMEVIGAHG